MIAIERMVQKIYPGKWAELAEIDKRYDEIEHRMGFPAKKRYQCIIGQYDQNTLVIERAGLRWNQPMKRCWHYRNTRRLETKSNRSLRVHRTKCIHCCHENLMGLQARPGLWDARRRKLNRRSLFREGTGPQARAS